MTPHLMSVMTLLVKYQGILGYEELMRVEWNLKLHRERLDEIAPQ